MLSGDSHQIKYKDSLAYLLKPQDNVQLKTLVLSAFKCTNEIYCFNKNNSDYRMKQIRIWSQDLL